jgi:hypothetical protein
MESSDYYDPPHKQSPTFHSKCRINKGLIKGKAQWIIEGRGARAKLLWPTLTHSFIHSWSWGRLNL